MDAATLPLPGRTCDSCALCCNLLKIEALDKPAGTWCRHCSTQRRCDIYEQRPSPCVTFHCGYLNWRQVGDEWKPSDCKIVLLTELEGRRICARVDGGQPDAWRREPYHSTLRKWAAEVAPHGVQVIVSVEDRVFVILPERDVDLGVVADDDHIVTAVRHTPDGPRYNALKLKEDDPRIRRIVGGAADDA